MENKRNIIYLTNQYSCGLHVSNCMRLAPSYNRLVVKFLWFFFAPNVCSLCAFVFCMMTWLCGLGVWKVEFKLSFTPWNFRAVLVLGPFTPWFFPPFHSLSPVGHSPRPTKTYPFNQYAQHVRTTLTRFFSLSVRVHPLQHFKRKNYTRPKCTYDTKCEKVFALYGVYMQGPRACYKVRMDSLYFLLCVGKMAVRM